MNRMDIALPLLIASQHLVGLARDTDSTPIYEIIDLIDDQIFAAYDITKQLMYTSKFGEIYDRTVVAYRLGEITISECLNSLEELTAELSGQAPEDSR